MATPEYVVRAAVGLLNEAARDAPAAAPRASTEWTD